MTPLSGFPRSAAVGHTPCSMERHRIYVRHDYRISNLQGMAGQCRPPDTEPQERMKESGFTLAEVTIGVSIIGLLAGITYRQTDAWDRIATRGAADQFISAHQKARTAAVRFGAVAELHIDASTDRFWVQIDTTSSGSGVMDTIGSVVDLSEHHVDLRATRSLLCFDPRGLIAAAAGCPSTGSLAIGLSRGSSSDTLNVTASGLLFRGAQ